MRCNSGPQTIQDKNRNDPGESIFSFTIWDKIQDSPLESEISMSFHTASLLAYLSGGGNSLKEQLEKHTKTHMPTKLFNIQWLWREDFSDLVKFLLFSSSWMWVVSSACIVELAAIYLQGLCGCDTPLNCGLSRCRNHPI